MENPENEFEQEEYNDDDAISFIHKHLPEGLKMKIDDEIISLCLDLLDEYGQEKGVFYDLEEQEPSEEPTEIDEQQAVTVDDDVIGELLPELLPEIDHSELIAYAKKKLIEEDYYLSDEELELIYDLEIAYAVSIGAAEIDDEFYRLTREN